jgi:hypothetical protein
VHVVAQNVSLSKALPADGRIELAFDRYLLPFTVTRQSFSLHDLQNNVQTPNVAYDPVARVVTITPAAPLQAGVNYVISIDPNGLRSIDGAPIDPSFVTIEFPVAAADAGAAQPSPPTVDFCNDIQPIFRDKCAYCHTAPGPGGPSAPAAGLSLSTPESILATAVGRVAQGANTGPRASPQPAGALFGVDMPIIDPGSGGPSGGNPGNSWLMYKVLLAVPSPTSMVAAVCDGGTTVPTDVTMAHLVAQPAFSDPVNDPARAILADYVLGREMPFPGNPGAALDQNNSPISGSLTIDELERISRWIAQPLPPGGALVPSTCPCSQ